MTVYRPEPYLGAPEIGVGIPSFERTDLFEKALDSVLGQRDVRVEIVVADDSRSTAISATLAARGEAVERVRLVQGARTGNPVDNWNLSLNCLAADIRVLLHQDDELADPLYLRRCVDALSRRGAVAGVARVQMVGIERRSRHYLTRWMGFTPLGPMLLPLINWIGHTAAFPFKGAARFDPDFTWLADVEFYSRLFATGRVVRVPGTGVRCRGHYDRSITASLDIARTWPAELALWANKHPDRLPPLCAKIFASAVEVRERVRRRDVSGHRPTDDPKGFP